MSVEEYVRELGDICLGLEDKLDEMFIRVGDRVAAEIVSENVGRLDSGMLPAIIDEDHDPREFFEFLKKFVDNTLSADIDRFLTVEFTPLIGKISKWSCDDFTRSIRGAAHTCLGTYKPVRITFEDCSDAYYMSQENFTPERYNRSLRRIKCVGKRFGYGDSVLVVERDRYLVKSGRHHYLASLKNNTLKSSMLINLQEELVKEAVYNEVENSLRLLTVSENGFCVKEVCVESDKVKSIDISAAARSAACFGFKNSDKVYVVEQEKIFVMVREQRACAKSGNLYVVSKEIRTPQFWEPYVASFSENCFIVTSTASCYVFVEEQLVQTHDISSFNYDKFTISQGCAIWQRFSDVYIARLKTA